MKLFFSLSLSYLLYRVKFCMSVKSEGCSSLCLLLGTCSWPTYLNISFLVCLAVDILAVFRGDISAMSSLTSDRFPSLLVTVFIVNLHKPLLFSLCVLMTVSPGLTISASPLGDTNGNFLWFLMVSELDFHVGLVIPMLVLIVLTKLHTEIFPMIHGLSSSCPCVHELSFFFSFALR